MTSPWVIRAPPPVPAWILFVKIAIIFLSVVIFCLACYAASLFNSYGGIWGAYYSSGTGGFLIFVTLKTFIVFGVWEAIERMSPQSYMRIVALVTYILSVIFWLSGWAYAANNASAFLSLNKLIGDFDNLLKREGSVLAACAALGAVVWVLTVVHLAIFINSILKEGRANAQQQAELGQVQPGFKAEAQAPPPPAAGGAPMYPQGQYPQQQYPQQPYTQ